MIEEQPDTVNTPLIAITAGEAARALRLPYTTFIDKVRRGEVPFVVVGGGRHRTHRRFLLEDLRAWADRNRVPAKWEAEEPVSSETP